VNTLKCCIDGCKSIFQTEEPLAPDAKYTCRLHLPSKQRVHFQSHQFDKQLRNGRSPVGTNHIKNQGSQITSVGESVLAEPDE
jgi:hypothetical protein